MRSAVTLTLLSLTLGLAPLAGAAHCTQDATQPSLHRVKEIQSSLLAYRLRDEMDEQVPPILQRQIRMFKDGLVEYADQVLACAPADVDVKSLLATMSTQLGANRPEPRQEPSQSNKPPQLDHIYGDSLTVKATAPANVPHLLLVEFNFGVACGDDSLLVAYGQRDGSWKRMLQWQSPDYDSVAHAFGDFFQYVALPKSGASGWLLAVAHGFPWCTSRWSGFDLDLLQPSADPKKAQVLEHINHGYVRFEIEPMMKSVPNGFQLRLQTGMIDPDIMTRIGVYRYHLNGTRLERVQPVANNGRDFVDEWLQSPWSEAAEWSAPSALTALRQIHKEIHEDVLSSSASEVHTFGPVRSCLDSQSHFQVELDEQIYNEDRKLQPGDPTYFQIQQGHNSFTMLAALPNSDPRCTGPDIMPKQ